MENKVPYEIIDIIYQYEGRSLPRSIEINRKRKIQKEINGILELSHTSKGVVRHLLYYAVNKINPFLMKSRFKSKTL